MVKKNDSSKNNECGEKAWYAFLRRKKFKTIYSGFKFNYSHFDQNKVSNKYELL